jgi:ferritin
MEKKLVDQLNKQINEEMHSAYIYAAMAAYFEFKNSQGYGQLDEHAGPRGNDARPEILHLPAGPG